MERENQIIRTLIIVNVLDFIKTNEQRFRLEAIVQLKKLSKAYKTPVSNTFNDEDLSECLRNFVLNKDGYNKTIPKLYSSLNK